MAVQIDFHIEKGRKETFPSIGKLCNNRYEIFTDTRSLTDAYHKWPITHFALCTMSDSQRFLADFKSVDSQTAFDSNTFSCVQWAIVWVNSSISYVVAYLM